MSSKKLAAIKIKTNKISSHPWIYRMHLDEASFQSVSNGSPAALFAQNGDYLGCGFFNGHARIGFRLLSRKVANTEADFFEIIEQHINRAINFRKCLNIKNDQTNALRLINSEGDFLSGLIVDSFGSHLVLQYTSSGMYYIEEKICAAIRKYWPFDSFHSFAEDHVQAQESFNHRTPLSITHHTAIEHGLKYLMDFRLKHKTGFYSDQRTVRKNFSTYCTDKSVLDLCSFSGAFAMNASLNGGARRVVAVEYDENLVPIIKKNLELNSINNVEVIHGEAVTYARENAKDFDVVVFDPPKQVRNKKDLEKSLQRYQRLNSKIMRVLRPGTILVTCSCSGLVSIQDYESCLRKAASDAQRDMRIFNISGQSEDHPTAVNCPEGRYLKVFWCYVE